jgi:hypothetical protein
MDNFKYCSFCKRLNLYQLAENLSFCNPKYVGTEFSLLRILDRYGNDTKKDMMVAGFRRRPGERWKDTLSEIFLSTCRAGLYTNDRARHSGRRKIWTRKNPLEVIYGC